MRRGVPFAGIVERHLRLGLRRTRRQALPLDLRRFRTGVAWRDVPPRYGSWATLHTLFRRWAEDGTFERMLRAAQAQADAAGDIDWLVSVDSTVVRARQSAAGARKGEPRTRRSAAPEAG
ncbi:transposase [Kitasatospora sp. NPDC056273]|uniref:transposase n=1 Tax=Kitasatospora sp. NPDC056273 TaxID=3345769 RepID=UPI0035E3A867